MSFKSVAAKGFIEVLSTQAVLLLLVSQRETLGLMCECVTIMIPVGCFTHLALENHKPDILCLKPCQPV